VSQNRKSIGHIWNEWEDGNEDERVVNGVGDYSGAS